MDHWKSSAPLASFHRIQVSSGPHLDLVTSEVDRGGGVNSLTQGSSEEEITETKV